MDPVISKDTTRNTTDRYGWEYSSVAPTVEDMQLPTHPYEDSSSLAQMRADCLAAQSTLARAATRAVEPAPSILFEDFPQDIPKREIDYSVAAARLAGALHLHLD
jgi:hypothetical protein